jgi:hypothetical protein
MQTHTAVQQTTKTTCKAGNQGAVATGISNDSHIEIQVKTAVEWRLSPNHPRITAPLAEIVPQLLMNKRISR